MKTKIKINSVFGKLLFEYESAGNSIVKTLIEAIKSNTNLRYANLSDANLSDADLSDADLSDADLSNTNLRYANLRYANLSDAYLSDADLSGADLSGAYLSGANLSGAYLSGAVKLPMFCKWSHGITGGDLIHIGCEKRTIEDWDIFFNSEDIITTSRNTDDFKRIQAVYEAYKAYLIFLNKDNK